MEEQRYEIKSVEELAAAKKKYAWLSSAFNILGHIGFFVLGYYFVELLNGKNISHNIIIVIESLLVGLLSLSKSYEYSNKKRSI